MKSEIRVLAEKIEQLQQANSDLALATDLAKQCGLIIEVDRPYRDFLFEKFRVGSALLLDPDQRTALLAELRQKAQEQSQ